MIRKNVLKAFALGLCMSTVFATTVNIGTAYGQLGGEISANEGVNGREEKMLFDKQKELDQYLFVDYAEKIESMGFEVIHTGVGHSYVEVGITPYSDKNAEYLYGIIGDELVKIVDTEAVALYTTSGVGQDAVEPVAYDNVASPIMDMGNDTLTSDGIADDTLIKEKEKLVAEMEEEEQLSIQIESIEENDSVEDVAPDMIKETDLTLDLPVEDKGDAITEEDTDGRLVSTEDDLVQVTSAEDTEYEDKGAPTATIIAFAAGGIIIIGGAATFISARKKAGKNKR